MALRRLSGPRNVTERVPDSWTSCRTGRFQSHDAKPASFAVTLRAVYLRSCRPGTFRLFPASLRRPRCSVRPTRFPIVICVRCFLMMPAACLSAVARAEEPKEETKPAAGEQAETLAGHSYHGEAFNEGPRQSAYLMDGLGRVKFPVTTSKPMAQRFVTQGVAQLHGFWYFEAERSFRQAAAIDAECAMAYWGMAMANKGNSKRAKG